MPALERPCAIRRALATYLRAHPLACDTAAGIARWWMPQELDVTEFELLPLLERYRSRGLIGSFVTADGRCFYRRRRHRHSAAAAPAQRPAGGRTHDLH